MKLIIYDLEVFRKDFLFGSLILNGDKTVLYQTWDLNDIRQFFNDHKDDSVFIGWNSKYYDNIVLEAALNGDDPYLKSKEIISQKGNVWSRLRFYTYDAMNTGFGDMYSLKLTELISGKSIDTSEVDFDIDRPLTQEEKEKTEKYNYSDLLQTLYNFKVIYDVFELRLETIRDWGLDLMKCLDMTGAQIAAEVLQAKRDKSLEFKPVKPIVYPNLIVENKDAMDFYLNEEFRIQGAHRILKIGNAELKLAAGGIHQAIKKCYRKRLMYLDVSGYYNLVEINLDLFSRTISEEGKKRYKMMYGQQLELKKIDPSSKKRKQFKTLLLSVFGAQGYPNSPFYDPYICKLIPITGELFLIDLLEKIQHLCTIIQSNTDGIMIEPNSDEDEKEILRILDAWLKRTGFVIKPKYIYDLFQRDVNCYIYRDEKGNVETKGEAVKNYEFSDKTYASGDIFNSKEPSIIAKGIVDCLMHDISPEETVEKYKKDLRLFQYPCKKGAFDYLTYDVTYFPSTGISSYKIQSPSRAFALKSNVASGMVYKHGINKKSGKVSKSKVSNLPDNVFVYNKDITNAYEELKDKIDYEYYVNRIYERIGEFI